MRLVASLTGLAVLVTAEAAELPPAVERVLTGHGISPDDVSIVVENADSAELLLSHLPDVPRNPASVMKLVTTWAALETLGPAYSWRTEVYFDGKFDGTVLDGNLGIKGYGDPFLVVEELWKMLRTLRSTGLEHIDGDLVLDDSYFSVSEDPPGAFDGEPYRTYNVLPSALMANFKAVRFQFVVDPLADRVRIVTDPELRNLDVRNRIKLVDGPCGGFQAGISFNVDDPETLSRVTFDGDYSRGCGIYSMSRTVLEHDTYVYGLFETLWSELGGSMQGGMRKGVIGAEQARVLTWSSPPLADVIRSINKNSNNVMTRQLVYTLAAEVVGPPGTRAAGIGVIRDFLHSRGIDAESLVLVNGAGLSRDERISARALADVLRVAAQSPYAAEYVSSLSLGGLDGTTRGRFDGDGNGRIHVKTGRLDHVSALAGYVHADDGRTFVVVVFGNFTDAHRGLGQELEEAVVDWAEGL
ncbi:MAG TPA: D-alanyl-D-alanine carboxypeptidase/D-alanyl-D-alanine-endopeptidase [Gammaproteobacteria bacterium]|jgi:D-alanyl-D-alanine carboxypeptidase/D-alanyl-D-alanine-endopeptidase (penicillin-binding protein 4)